MSLQLRELAKHIGGWFIANSNSQRYDFSNCLFILAHMRCGSTALSNILCSREDVSGYGETHISYESRNSLGRLAINQKRRGGWKSGANVLFDKILHSRLDQNTPEQFYNARAIFVLREPEPTIRSIHKLFAGTGQEAYQDHKSCAQYYAERVNAMAEHWDRFTQERRIGILHQTLLQDPEAVLAEISGRLKITPPLKNRYDSLAASRQGGGGDPVESGKHNRIEPTLLKPIAPLDSLDLSDAHIASVQCAYQAMFDRISRNKAL